MRPKKCRRIDFDPRATVFKPAGIPMRELEYVELDADEAEALRLADYEQLYHAEAGERMGVSRQTFSRVLQKARQKVADAVIHGKCLVLRGEEPEEG